MTVRLCNPMGYALLLLAATPALAAPTKRRLDSPCNALRIEDVICLGLTAGGEPWSDWGTTNPVRVEGTLQMGPSGGAAALPVLTVAGTVAGSEVSILEAATSDPWRPCCGFEVQAVAGMLLFEAGTLVKANVSNSDSPMSKGWGDVYQVSDVVVTAEVFKRAPPAAQISASWERDPSGHASPPPAAPAYVFEMRSAGAVQIGPANTSHSIPALLLSGRVNTDGTALLAASTSDEWTPFGGIQPIPELTGTLKFDSFDLVEASVSNEDRPVAFGPRDVCRILEFRLTAGVYARGEITGEAANVTLSPHGASAAPPPLPPLPPPPASPPKVPSGSPAHPPPPPRPQAIQIDLGRFTTAAKLQKEIADLCESDGDTAGAMDAYQQALV